MSSCQPAGGLSFLSPVSFSFKLRRAPKLTYFVQTIALPGLTLAPAIRPSPFVNIPTPGDHVEYSPLSLTFKVDENMGNWLELYQWINEMGAPLSFDQYNKEEQEPDGTLLILDSNSQPNVEVSFYNMFPTELGRIDFDVSSTDVNYVTSDASFVYMAYKVKIL